MDFDTRIFVGFRRHFWIMTASLTRTCYSSEFFFVFIAVFEGRYSVRLIDGCCKVIYTHEFRVFCWRVKMIVGRGSPFWRGHAETFECFIRKISSMLI